LRTSVHPIVFLILYLPYGITSGYVLVTLEYLLSTSGVTVTQIAALAAISYLPQTWKVLWAPIIDTTLTAKRWYFISTAVTGLILLGMAFVPTSARTIELLDLLSFILNVACSFSAMATESLMARTTSHDQMGRAGGWSQAGNLGGGGLGGGAGLWMAQHVAPWSAGAVLGAFSMACCVTLWFCEEQYNPRQIGRYRTRLLEVAKDVWSVARSRIGLLALFLFLLPIGTGAASNLWAAVATDWHADGDTVALVNGALGGLISMAGCLLGGYFCDLIDRKSAYAIFGTALALCAAAMAAAPRTRAMFILFTGLYGFALGLCYAGFSSVTLEAIGKDSPATKYNLMACVSNIPIAGMTMIDGWAQTRWGSGNMLYVETLLALVGVILFAAVALATRRPLPALVAE